MNDPRLDWHLRINLTDEFGDGQDGKTKRKAYEQQLCMDLAIKKLQSVRNSLSIAIGGGGSALTSKLRNEKSN